MLIGRALAAYPIGKLMDTLGRRPALALGYLIGIGGAVTAALAVMAGSFPGLVAGSLLFGMARVSNDQARYVAAEVHSTDQRGFIIGLIVFAGTVGAIAVPGVVAVSTGLAEGGGSGTFAGPWFAAAVLVCASFVLTVGLVRPDPRDLSLTNGVEGRPDEGFGLNAGRVRSLREIFSAGHVRLAVFSMFIGQAVMVLVMTIAPVHMHDHGHVPTTISIAVTVHTLGMFGLAAITGRLVDRYGRTPIIAVGASQLMVASLLIPFTHHLALMLVMMFLLGYGWNLCFVAGSSLLIDGLGPRERGRTQGTGDGIVAVSAAVGALATGPVFGAGGMGHIGAAAIAFSLVLIVVLGWRRLPRQSVSRVP